MGSVSHYLVQKSSVPVMVARRRLRAPPKVYKRRADLDRNARVPLDQAAIEKESRNQQTTVKDDEETEGKEGEEEKKEGEKGKEDSDSSDDEDEDAEQAPPGVASDVARQKPEPEPTSGAPVPPPLTKSTTPDVPAPTVSAPIPAASASNTTTGPISPTPHGTPAKDPAAAETDNSPPV